MDFDFHFNKEDEGFRLEVRKWLEENVPADMEWPEDPEDVPPELVDIRDNLTSKLGAKGWYAPDWPKEYGGGGMDDERVAILKQEFNRMDKGMLLGFVYAPYVTPLLEYGSEELKRELIPPLLRGETSWWLVETEPEHGTDNAAMESTAIRDGDYYIANGEKIYVGNQTPKDLSKVWGFTPMVTKPGAPRHENLGVFALQITLPGIRLERMSLIGAEDQKYRLYMKDARIPAKYLIGGPEARGWDVLQASLSSEHGGGGNIVQPESLSSKLIQFCKETKRNSKPLASDPIIREILVKLWIEDQKERLYALSTYWTAKTGEWVGKGYKGVQQALHEKVHSPKLAKEILNILGPYAVTNDKELRVLKGEVERAERMGCVTHIAGTPETHKILATRAIGMTRPKETKEKGGE